MQLKPRFEKFKIKEKHQLLKDDTGAIFYLTKIEAYIPSDKSEITITPYEYWCVINNNTGDWSNKKVTSFGSEAFWRSSKRNTLIETTICGIKIKEVVCGKHYVFCTKKMPIEEDGDFGVRTTFEISTEN